MAPPMDPRRFVILLLREKRGCMLFIRKTVACQLPEMPDCKLEDMLGYAQYCSNETADRYRAEVVHEEHTLSTEFGAVRWYANSHFGAYLYSCRLLRRYSLQFPVGVKGYEDVIFLQLAGLCSEQIRYKRKLLYIYRMNPYSYTHRLSRGGKKEIENSAHVACAWFFAAEWGSHLSEPYGKALSGWRDFCQAMAGARMLEAARQLAVFGVPYRNMVHFLEQGEHSYLFSYIKLNSLAEWQKKDLELYKRSAKMFYCKFRLLGMVQRILRRMLRVKCIRAFREAKDFPLTDTKL